MYIYIYTMRHLMLKWLCSTSYNKKLLSGFKAVAGGPKGCGARDGLQECGHRFSGESIGRWGTALQLCCVSGMSTIYVHCGCLLEYIAWVMLIIGVHTNNFTCFLPHTHTHRISEWKLGVPWCRYALTRQQRQVGDGSSPTAWPNQFSVYQDFVFVLQFLH